MQVANVKYVERSLSVNGTIMRGTYSGRPVVEAIVCGLPIWAQIFLMPDRCKQQPKT